jgi:hypothetical protein
MHAPSDVIRNAQSFNHRPIYRFALGCEREPINRPTRSGRNENTENIENIENIPHTPG